MKKTISSLVILLMFLVPALGNASYLIRLKNGGQLATQAYWTEGKWLFFYCVGGTAGMERMEIDRIERDDTYDNMGAVGGNIEKKAPPPPPQTKEGVEKQELPQPSQAKEKEEKIDLKALKNKKDQMTAEVDKLIEKMEEASDRNDNDAKQKIKEEIRAKAEQIYKFTDEVTEKNRGKLPDGWWEKK